MSADNEPDRTRDYLLTITLLERVLLEVADERSWRVCDRNVESGPGRFIAFIEEKNQRFEVMRITDTFEWSTFPTMWDALVDMLKAHAE